MNKFIISESEKQRILNMHKSSSSRHYLSEATMDPEPVISGSYTYKIYFAEDGYYTISKIDQTAIKNWLRPFVYQSLPTLKKFFKDPQFPLPKFITIGAGTTSTGTYEENASLADKRIESVKTIVKELLKEKGFLSMNAEQVEKLITTNTDYTYTPTNVDANFSDRNLMDSDDKERFAYVEVKGLKTKGLFGSEITDLEHDIEDAKGLNIDPDETEIARQVCRLETYSDITELNNRLRGGLQYFVNSTITNNILHYDTEERKKIMGCLNTASNNSGKGDIAAIAGDKITIMID